MTIIMKHLTGAGAFLAVSFLYFVSGCKRVNLPGSTLESDISGIPTSTYIVPVTSESDPLDGTRWLLVAFESEGTFSLGNTLEDIHTALEWLQQEHVFH